MIALWIIVGCIAVSVAYFLPGASPELWPNLDAAGTALAVYVALSLIVFAGRQDLSRKRRIIVVLFGVAGIWMTSFTWSSVRDQTEWQARTLGEIGTTITRGIYNSALSDSLLDVLQSFHEQRGPVRASLGDVYRSIYPKALEGDSMSTLGIGTMGQEGAPPSADVFVVHVSDTQIVWVARHPWYMGKDPDHTGESASTGRVQVRLTLTQKGVEYVTEN